MVLETDAGVLIESRDSPRTAFAGHVNETPWDRLHAAYFNAYALWTYLTQPFLYAYPGFVAEEVESWEENSETWRGLTVIFPDNIASHAREQITYFGADGLRVGCFGLFLVGREAARRLAPLRHGKIIFTGASASLGGKPGFAHFAAAKAGLRMIARSMAREYGPLGIHVAYVVIDGGIDGDRLRNRAPTLIKERGLLGIDAIAETYWHIHRQPRSAWTQEVDLRPFKETL